MRVPWIWALVGSVVGLHIGMFILDEEIEDIRDDALIVDERVVEAEARAELLAKRVFVLTEAANDQRVVLDRLSAACVAAGDCVEVEG